MHVQIKADSKRRIRGSEDIPTLLEELKAEDWAGPRLSVLSDDAWLYGWDILRGKIRTDQMGTIKTGKVPPPVLSDTALGLLKTDAGEREGVVIETLGLAVPALIHQLRAGTFDPDRGAALETYFVGGCAIAYKKVVTKWANALAERWGSLDDRVGLLFQAIPGDWESDQVDLYEMRRSLGRLLREMSPVQKQIAARVGIGMTHAEIADDLNLSSPRAVEGQMSRIRKMGWGLVGTGHLGELFTTGILTSRFGDEDPSDFSLGSDPESLLSLRSRLGARATGDTDALPDWIDDGNTP